jgi:thiamine biosynthesis protein ThiS
MMRTEISRDSISLTLNGEHTKIRPGTTLAELLSSLGLHPRQVVVEHNRGILRERESFSATELHDGDVLEVVHFVGGG